MFLDKLSIGVACGLVLAVASFTAWAAVPGVPEQKLPKPLPARAAARAPVPPAANVPRPDVTAPILYKDLMLVLVSKEGAAAVVFHDPEDEGSAVSYKFRYESADGKTSKAGEGKLFERRLDGGKGEYDPAGLDIIAGPIALRWSKSNTDRGWIYYAPEVVQVHMANADLFEDRIVEIPLRASEKREYKKIDLKRYMRK